ncbi:MAG: DUF1573 domain-containing protein [Fimbriimonadales bacterium]|nr:DUF1573 domain-containing protein [Fimbriimonadales bacterium]
MKKALPLLIAVLALTAGWSQNAPRAPLPPDYTVKIEYDQLYQAANLLSRSDFDGALNLLKGIDVPATIRVYASWATIPVELRSSFRQAAIDAVTNWNRALNGNPKLEWTEDEANADVQIVFEEDVAEITAGQFRLMHGKARLILPPQKGEKRRVRTRIATYIPYTEMPQGAKAVAHLVGQAIGTYLGLAESQKDTEIMGPVWNTEELPTAPTAEEVERARNLMQIRRELLNYANRRVAVYIPKPKIVVEPMEHDFGDVAQGDNVKFTFKVRNEGDAPLEITARPSCGCVTPHYDRVIQPKQEGVLEAELRTAGFRGNQVKTIQVTSNDPDQSNLTLRLTANIKTAIDVRPSEMLAITLKEGEPTVQEVEVVSNTKEPLEIQQITTSAPYVKAEAQRIDEKRQKVTITINPDAPPGRNNFVVTARTNLQGAPQVNITLMAEKGIIVTPTNVFFGVITPQTQLPIERIVTLSRRDKGFQIRKINADNPAIEVNHESMDDGKQHRLIIRYKGGWPAGVAQHKVTIETDDPKQSTIQITLTANVVAAGGF